CRARRRSAGIDGATDFPAAKTRLRRTGVSACPHRAQRGRRETVETDARTIASERPGARAHLGVALSRSTVDRAAAFIGRRFLAVCDPRMGAGPLAAGADASSTSGVRASRTEFAGQRLIWTFL